MLDVSNTIFIDIVHSVLTRSIILNYLCYSTLTFRQFWSVSKWEDAAFLSGFVALLYFCLEAPHVHWSGREFSRFMFHVGHKFALTFSMTLALWHFKDMKKFYLNI